MNDAQCIRFLNSCSDFVSTTSECPYMDPVRARAYGWSYTSTCTTNVSTATKAPSAACANVSTATIGAANLACLAPPPDLVSSNILDPSCRGYTPGTAPQSFLVGLPAPSSDGSNVPHPVLYADPMYFCSQTDSRYIQSLGDPYHQDSKVQQYLGTMPMMRNSVDGLSYFVMYPGFFINGGISLPFHFNANSNLNGGCALMTGFWPDCPTPLGENGACAYEPLSGEIAHGCGQQSTPGFLGGALYDAGPYCAKTQWDQSYSTLCCLGLEAQATASFDPFFWPMLTPQRLCDPSWCPKDPTGACGAIMAQTCSALGSNSSCLLTTPGHPCNTWYNTALSTPGPYSPAWPFIDLAVQRFCTANPTHDACKCWASGSVSGAGKIPYTSVTDLQPIGGGAAPGVRQVQSLDMGNGYVPVNITEPACLNPTCMVGMGAGTQLVTWSMKQIIEECPSVCYQVLESVGVDIGSLTSGASLYIGANQLACGGSNASLSPANPVPVMDPQFTFYVPTGPAHQSPEQFAVDLINLAPALLPGTNNPSGADFAFKASLSPAATTGVTMMVQDSGSSDPQSGTKYADSGATFLTIMIEVDPTEIGDSVQNVVLTLTNTNASQSPSSVSTNIQIVPYYDGAPPTGPTCPPQGCQPPGFPPYELIKTTPAEWMIIMVVALGVLLALVTLRWAFSLSQKKYSIESAAAEMPNPTRTT